MRQNLSSAAVMIGALRVNSFAIIVLLSIDRLGVRLVSQNFQSSLGVLKDCAAVLSTSLSRLKKVRIFNV